MVSTTKTERTTERDRFIWLYNNCQNRVAIAAASSPEDDRKSAVFEDQVQKTETRPLAPEDVKVTVKWSTNTQNNQLAHLSPIEGSSHYKLGIRFKRWRRHDPEQKLVTLGHELGHARYGGHERYYWSFVIDIWKNMLEHQDHLESWFDQPINWDVVRSNMVDDVYDNSDPPHRAELMEWAGEQLEYPSDWTVTLDWGRGLRETTHHWNSEDISRIEGDQIRLSRSYSDEELVQFYKSLETNHGNISKVPPVTGRQTSDGYVELVENEIVAALCLRTQYQPEVPVILSNVRSTPR